MSSADKVETLWLVTKPDLDGFLDDYMVHCGKCGALLCKVRKLESEVHFQAYRDLVRTKAKEHMLAKPECIVYRLKQ